jgi:methylphosphotriester-DNA--protein-cysteine methyltransferase
MQHHKHLTPIDLRNLIHSGEIQFAGWFTGKIYGHLSCISGKHKINRENRVFFKTEQEALQLGYRPCAICMKNAYKVFKNKQIEK